MSDASPTVFNGRYALQRQLARGGMADVFLAHDQLLDRPVAVKVLFPEFATDPSFVERFRREAQAAANLSHPNIVGVFDWGQENDTYFIVMEYVEGRSLADVLRSEGTIDSERAVEITSEVAAALSFAHRNGLIHRDVKPGNVMVTPSGQVKVADFGIATAANTTGGENLTKTGLVMGTATYFSPEQAQGRAVDPRSDLYSLGVVLYEMLSGVPPFHGDSPVAIAYQHVQEAPPSFSEHGLPAGDALEAITMKLLAKNPAHRYPAADDLRADLRRYSEGMRRLARPAAAAGAGALVAQRRADATTTMAATTATPRVGGSGGGYDDGGYPTRGGGAPRRGGGSSARTGVFAVLIVLVLIVLAAIFLLLFTGDDPSGPAETDTVDVPSLFDETEEAATATLRGLDLVPEVVYEENLDVEAGRVFRQNPVGGFKVDPGTTVVLTVSKGQTTVSVPNVVASQVTEAEARLRGLGLDVVLVPDPTSLRPENEVLSQDPPEGTRLEAGEPVTLGYSAPEAVILPDLAGQLGANAAIQLRSQNLLVDVQEEEHDTIEAGKVTRTEPVAGSSVKPNTQVTLYVSSGVPQVTMPDVKGLLFSSAQTTLEGLGLVIDVQFVEVAAGQDGRVQGQNPAASVKVVKGTTVTLRVGRVPEPSPTTTAAPSPTTTSASP